ncbi:hypothetical protein M404DRAFT_833000 [Pisolithus tinctorius Marx 270]|uniref:Uncharacterized protein n=1 Tax=Pisolithus tinctorius Marx 270 TaxID=870435 RepID=A0A0C3PBM6_PISTI|nr:hypothetical protein M404DRAFT_833000 [Pisolithus tinctorius Marx 270]
MCCGGATFFAATGIPPSQIQAISRLSSLAWQHHVRKNPVLLQTLLFHGRPPHDPPVSLLLCEFLILFPSSQFHTFFLVGLRAFVFGHISLPFLVLMFSGLSCTRVFIASFFVRVLAVSYSGAAISSRIPMHCDATVVFCVPGYTPICGYVCPTWPCQWGHRNFDVPWSPYGGCTLLAPMLE